MEWRRGRGGKEGRGGKGDPEMLPCLNPVLPILAMGRMNVWILHAWPAPISSASIMLYNILGIYITVPGIPLSAGCSEPPKAKGAMDN